MGDPVITNVIDDLAAELFSRDHPERVWNGMGTRGDRIGSASPHEHAMYRGFARGRMMAERLAPVPPVEAAAALAADSDWSARRARRRA
jgi:hypothetical protein